MGRTGRRAGSPTALLAAVLAATLLAPGAAPLGAQASGPPLVPDHWAYELVEALDVAGATWSWAYDVRPAGRATVRGELGRSVRYGFGHGELVEAWLERFDRELPLGAPAGPTATDRASGPAFEIRARAGLRDGAAFLDPGSGAYGALSAAAAPGGGVTAWAGGTAGGRDRFGGLRSAGLTGDLGPFAVSVGRQRLRAAGPALTSSQLSSTVPVDALHVVSREPLPVPGLEWLAGPVSWQFALGPWSGAGSPDGGWIGLGGAVAEPHPRLRIGATRSAVFNRSIDAGITPDRLFRTVFLLQNEPFHWDDQKLELWARVRWGLFGQPLASYVVFAQEDAPLYLDSGVLVGTKAARITETGLWRLAWEYRGYGPRGQWCAWCERTRNGLTESGREQGQWYWHGPGPIPYARDGIPVGDETGGYGAQHRLELSHFSDGAAFRGRLWAFFQIREDERNLLLDRWPGKRRGLGVEGAWRVRPDLELAATALVTAGPEIGRESGLHLRASWSWGESSPGGAGGGEAAAGERASGAGDAAEIPAGVGVGDRVRIRAPVLLHRRAEGTVRSLRGDTVHLEDADGRPAGRIHASDVERLEVQDGSGDARWRGLLIGAPAGLLAGIALDEETRDDHFEVRPTLRIGGLVGGAALGWLVGRLVPVREWVELVPGPGG